MKKKMKKKVLGGMLCAFLFIMLGSNRTYTAEATVNFDADTYSVEENEEFEVKLSIQADGNIGLYNVSLRYDTARMQYIQGAEDNADGLLTLKGTGFGNEISYNLRFKAVGAGEAGIKIKEAYISAAEDESIRYTISSFAAVPIDIDGEATGEASFLDQLLAEEQAEASDNKYKPDTDIPIVGSITNDNGTTLYIVDLADYEPELVLWDYRLVTDTYFGENLTYFSDRDKNVRVLLTMDDKESFSLLAFKEDTQSFYPVDKITSNDSLYYIMSLDAVVSVSEEFTEEELNSNTIFYAIASDGTGGYYRYTSDGAIEPWGSPGLDATVGEQTNRGHIVTWIVIIAVMTLVIIAVLLVMRGLKRNMNPAYEADGSRQYIFVVRELTAREVKRKYARSHLGIIWSVLNPLLMMIVMSMVFSYMFKRSIENFPLYYLTGSIFWSLFSDGTTHAMTALVDNKALLIKAKLPRQIFVLSRMYTALVNFGFSCIPYAAMLIVFGVKPSWTMLLFPLDVMLTLMFAIGIGYILSILYVFFADIKYLYGVFLRILLYLTAIFYPITSLPETLQTYIGYNPVYMSIYIARECMVYGRVPHYTAWIKLGVAAVISCIIGWIVFKKKQNDVMQRI